MIDNLQLLTFINESIRTSADLLAGILPLPTSILDVVIGRDFASILGTTQEKLLRAEHWEIKDYTDLGEPKGILGSDLGGRSLLTNYDVIGLIRVLVSLNYMKLSNPSLGPLIGKIAANPRR